jgi:hypothetical protein
MASQDEDMTPPAHQADRAPQRRLYFSATIITMDGSDTNAYGEACEPGHGYTETAGWWNPDDEPWSVRRHRDHARPDRFPHPAATSPARWLADHLTQRLGPVDHFDGERTFYSAEELVRDSDTAPPRSVSGGAIHDPRRVLPVGAQCLSAAGHAHGFTSDEIVAAVGLLGLQPAGGSTDRRAARTSASPPARGFVAVQNPAQVSGPTQVRAGATTPPAPDRSGGRSR